MKPYAHALLCLAAVVAFVAAGVAFAATAPGPTAEPPTVAVAGR